MNGNCAIAILFLAHLAAVPICVWLNTVRHWPVSAEIAFSGLFASQMALLGICSALVPSKWWIRIATVFAGTVYLWVMATTINGLWNNRSQVVALCTLISIPTFVLFVVFLLVSRRYHLRPRQVDTSFPREPLRFSLAHLLIVTMAVAGIFAFGRFIRNTGDFVPGDVFGMVVFGGILAIGFSAIQLVNTWASFGYHAAYVRYLVAMSFTILVSLIPPYFFGGPTWRFYTWPALVTTMTVVVLASLFVVRASGYRLDKNMHVHR